MADKSARQKAPKHRQIFNLLKPYTPPASAWDKVYDWILGKARVVMILSEIIVAFAFIGKVIVDVDAKNLQEQIDIKDFELKQYATTVEPVIRTLQAKSLLYAELWNTSTSFAPVLKEAHRHVPLQTQDLSITLSNDPTKGLQVKGGESIEDLEQIEADVKSSLLFTNTQLKNLSVAGQLAAEAEYEILGEILNLYDRPPIGTIGIGVN